VTIEFFGLDDPRRKNLFRERAALVVALFAMLEDGNKKLIKGFQSPQSSHTSCARSFVRLYRQDRKLAAQLAERAGDFIAMNS
jgi:hypothetical protein